MDLDITFPPAVEVGVSVGVMTFKGPKGTVTRNLSNPSVLISVAGSVVHLKPKKQTQREKKLIRTYAAHLRNMAKGVTEGHLYKLKICSGHFPMSVTIKGQNLEIKNFIGEKVPRTTTIPEGVSVKIEGDMIIAEGIDKEKVGDAAARIEQLTRRPNFDARIFQDGIYITEKDGKTIAQ
ncbi:MAG: 50S ribosomal protein L6 [Candidatus Woesearchaeota archaeon]